MFVKGGKNLFTTDTLLSDDPSVNTYLHTNINKLSVKFNTQHATRHEELGPKLFSLHERVVRLRQSVINFSEQDKR